MSTRILFVVLIVAVVLAVPAAFLIGRPQSEPLQPLQPPPTASTQPAPTMEDVVVKTSPSALVREPPPQAEKPDGDLISGLFAAVSDRVVDESRRIVERTVDEVGKEVSARVDDASAQLEKELDQSLDQGRKELDRASRKLGDDLDQRSDALTRSTVEEGKRLAEQSEAIAKAERASADSINRTATDLRTLITTSVNDVNKEAEAAKAKLVKLTKDGSTRTQTLVGKVGVALPGTTTRISSELAAGLKRWLDDVNASQADFHKRTTDAHQRFTQAVTQAQADTEQHRQKALAVVQSAGESLRTKVAAAERELTDAVKRAKSETNQALGKITGQAEPQPASRTSEPVPRRGGK